MSVIIRNGDGSNMTAKLLYVEDNPYSVYLMQFYLRRHQDYKLTIATDGQSGWEQALLQEPDLIMMDINLPDINGWELTRKLKAHPLTKNIPIIAVTSLTMEDNYYRVSKQVLIYTLAKQQIIVYSFAMCKHLSIINTI